MMVTLQIIHMKNNFLGFDRCHLILSKLFKKYIYPLGNKGKQQGNLTPSEMIRITL